MKSPTTRPSAAFRTAILIAGVVVVVVFALRRIADERGGGSAPPSSNHVQRFEDGAGQRTQPPSLDHARAGGARTAEAASRERVAGAEALRFLGEGSGGGLLGLELALDDEGLNVSRLKALGPRVLVGRAGRLPLICETTSLEGGVPASQELARVSLVGLEGAEAQPRLQADAASRRPVDDAWADAWGWLLFELDDAPDGTAPTRPTIGDLLGGASDLVPAVSSTFTRRVSPDRLDWPGLSAGAYRLDYSEAKALRVVPDPLEETVLSGPDGRVTVVEPSVDPNGALSSSILLAEGDRRVVRTAPLQTGRVTGQLDFWTAGDPSPVFLKRYWEGGGVRRIEALPSGAPDEDGRFSFAGLPHADYVLTGYLRTSPGSEIFYQQRFRLDAPSLDLGLIRSGPLSVTIAPVLEVDGETVESPLDGRVSVTMLESTDTGGGISLSVVPGASKSVLGAPGGSMSATFVYLGDMQLESGERFESIEPSSITFEVSSEEVTLRPRVRFATPRGVAVSLDVEGAFSGQMIFMKDGVRKSEELAYQDGRFSGLAPPGTDGSRATLLVEVSDGSVLWKELAVPAGPIHLTRSEFERMEPVVLELPAELAPSSLMSCAIESPETGERGPMLRMFSCKGRTVEILAPPSAAAVYLDRRHRVPLAGR